MYKFLIANEKQGFLDDISTRLMLSDDRTIDVLDTVTSVEKINQRLEQGLNPDVIVISAGIAETQPDWNYGSCKVVAYARNEEESQTIQEMGLPCYKGVVKNATHLLNLMAGEIPSNGRQPKKAAPVENSRGRKDDSYYDERSPKRARVDDDYAPKRRVVDDEVEEDYRKSKMAREVGDSRHKTDGKNYSARHAIIDDDIEDDEEVYEAPRKKPTKRVDRDDDYVAPKRAVNNYEEEDDEEDYPVASRTKRNVREEYDDERDYRNSRGAKNSRRDIDDDYEDDYNSRRNNNAYYDDDEDDDDYEYDNNSRKPRAKSKPVKPSKRNYRDEYEDDDEEEYDDRPKNRNAGRYARTDDDEDEYRPKQKQNKRRRNDDYDDEYDDEYDERSVANIPRERVFGARDAEERIRKDLSRNKRNRTTVVTVYSAKGGVGKTTISTETAVYLSLTSGGRNKYRVCIIDYNIDFGDVRTVLNYKSKRGSNNSDDMYSWAQDIKARIDAGEDPNKIYYDKDEIEEYLQVSKTTGLYALCAPNVHSESLALDSEELEIMMRNVIDNGDFDFVVCDTGNNTRDSSVIALEAADYVLLVTTQDVTTASCNDSVLRTLDSFGLDLGKVYLVINNILASKYTSILVEDIEEYFKKYPCIAHIPHEPNVIKANNTSEPIVFQANHPVTKEFQKIVAFVTGNEDAVATKKKFKLFGRGKK